MRNLQLQNIRKVLGLTDRSSDAGPMTAVPTTPREFRDARLTLHHGEATFTDVFVLLEETGEWRIANKVYHRHAA